MRSERDRAIAQAVAEGRFPASRRAHYERLWGKDPRGTHRLLTASQADGGLAAVGELIRSRGRPGRPGQSDVSAEEAAHRSFFAMSFPGEARRLGLASATLDLSKRQGGVTALEPEPSGGDGVSEDMHSQFMASHFPAETRRSGRRKLRIQTEEE